MAIKKRKTTQYTVGYLRSQRRMINDFIEWLNNSTYKNDNGRIILTFDNIEEAIENFKSMYKK